MVLRQNQRRNRTIRRGKILLQNVPLQHVSNNNVYGVGPTLTAAFNNAENPDVWVPPQNWPVVLVKGETDPAIITGTLRYAGYNSTLYQLPIAEAGKVWAHMTMRIDPYTGQNRPDLATIDGQAYVNATANGHYELEGLAPGVYDIYAASRWLSAGVVRERHNRSQGSIITLRLLPATRARDSR